jgi:enterochelin esterase-like enzyme
MDKNYLILIVAVLLLAAGMLTLAQSPDTGTVEIHEFDSGTLERAYAYTVYLPAGYADSQARYPVLYLLHGRGDNMDAWLNVRATLDRMIAAGDLPPLIAVMPDFPSSSRGGYYVDSLLDSILKRPEPVETAFMNDLIPHVDATFRTVASREGRALGGYSMGGYGALRYALAYPQTFTGAIVLSPAVYTPLPPRDSSAREFGAFGVDKALFDEARYQSLIYPALTPAIADGDLPVYLFIAVGDDEWRHPDPEDYLHDLDMEAHLLYNHVSRIRNLYSELRVYNGGHDWSVWERGFAEGARYLSGFMQSGDAAAAPDLTLRASLLGTFGADLAGGVAALADGRFYQGVNVEDGIHGQTPRGSMDAALILRAADGTVEWTQQFGTPETDRAYGVAVDPDGGARIAGYTRGDLDGQHAGNAADDVFVASISAAGEPQWVAQFGDPLEADRAYGLTVDAAGNTVVTGYTRGALDGANAGDKDVILARLSPEGERLWLKQFGGEGEDKAYAVTAAPDGTLYVAGVTGSALEAGAAAGGLDAFLAAFNADGDALWMRQFGTDAWDEATGVTVTADGLIAVTGFSAGEFGGALVGDKDLFVAWFTPDGALQSADQVGTPLNDKGAAIAATADGGVLAVGFSDGRLTQSSGGFDIVLVKYDAGFGRAWTQQFGSSDADGADEWAEGNLYLAVSADTFIVSGLTLGAFGGDTPAGSTDVFLALISVSGE